MVAREVRLHIGGLVETLCKGSVSVAGDEQVVRSLPGPVLFRTAGATALCDRDEGAVHVVNRVVVLHILREEPICRTLQLMSLRYLGPEGFASRLVYIATCIRLVVEFRPEPFLELVGILLVGVAEQGKIRGSFSPFLLFPDVTGIPLYISWSVSYPKAKNAFCLHSPTKYQLSSL